MTKDKNKLEHLKVSPVLKLRHPQPSASLLQDHKGTLKQYEDKLNQNNQSN